MLFPILFVVAQTTAPLPAAPSEEIVVVGHRATDALEACLARQCPPAEDVEASLQASVEQFTAGRYDKARQTLQRSIHRNRAYAARLPGQVSSLYATLATVAEHEGDARLWESASRTNVEILRRHVGTSVPATLLQEISFSDTMIGKGYLATASEMLTNVEHRALEAGHSDIAAGAAIRRAWLTFAQKDDQRAVELADHAVAISDATKTDVTMIRDVLNSRVALRKGDAGAIDALAAHIRQKDTRRPRLLFSKPVEDLNVVTNDADSNNPDFSLLADKRDDSSIRFADVGYWIRPDGRAAGAEILQSNGLGQWEEAVLRQIGTRRYASLSLPAESPGVYRVDRFTIRATIGIPTGSRIQRRNGRLTTHIVDLTETKAMSAVARERALMTKQGS